MAGHSENYNQNFTSSHDFLQINSLFCFNFWFDFWIFTKDPNVMLHDTQVGHNSNFQDRGSEEQKEAEGKTRGDHFMREIWVFQKSNNLTGND